MFRQVRAAAGLKRAATSSDLLDQTFFESLGKFCERWTWKVGQSHVVFWMVGRVGEGEGLGDG